MNPLFEAAARATHAAVYNAQEPPTALHVVTDTRELAPGDTFLALHGDRFNGHDFVREAIAKGAAAIVIDDPNARESGTPTLLVSDTLAAYLSLAGLARDNFGGRVIAITGSSGKTTTKFLLAQLLAARYGERIATAPANENNEVGVSKLLLRASNDSHDVLVIEMGARHVGDIATLVHIAKPHIGILTNIGDAHLEIMGSRSSLAQTKWALFDEGARAVLNLADEESRRRAPQLLCDPHWFAATDEAAPSGPGEITALVGKSLLFASSGRGDAGRSVNVRLPGAHNRANLAAALAGAIELGVDPDALAAAIPTLSLPPGRFESIALTNGVRIIHDAYNANVSGMFAALDAFAEESGLRIAVLGSMAELGDNAPAMHESVGAHAAAAGLAWLLVGGEHADDLARGARDAGFSSERIVSVTTNQATAEWLREHARAGDIVLLKGSRKYKLEEIVTELRG